MLKVPGVPNLYLLETLSSVKVADLLQKNLAPSRAEPLNVYLQVNTSGEDAKSGLAPLTAESDTSAELVSLAKHVIVDCPGLRLLGLMTIGSWDASHDASQPNPDFSSLAKSRENLVRLLRESDVPNAPKNERDLELSMGMSADFAQAIKEGSSSVRVGTRIFGQRPPRK